MALGRNTINAYSAGFLDGEGCVYFKNSPTVEITNKHKHPLFKLRKKWGGNVRSKSGDGQVYVWSVYGSQALTFLRAVKKYSIIKHNQIETLMKFCKLRNNKNCKTKKVKLLKKLKDLKNAYPS